MQVDWLYNIMRYFAYTDILQMHQQSMLAMELDLSSWIMSVALEMRQPSIIVLTMEFVSTSTVRILKMQE